MTSFFGVCRRSRVSGSRSTSLCMRVALAVLTIGMVCSGCGGSSPKKTANALLKAASTGDVSALTRLTHSLVLEEARVHAAMRGISISEYVLESFTGGASALRGLSWKIESATEIPEGSAIVRYTAEIHGYQKTGLHMLLALDNGEWKFVSFLQ